MDGNRMIESPAENRQRLFALDAGLRAEADRMLEASGLGGIIRAEGYHPVGSYLMRTMTWRDLDFERFDESPDWNKHWETGKKFTQLEWVWSVHAINGYADPRKPDNDGYYWGLRAVRPGEKAFWKLDLWTARRQEFERAVPKRPLWESRLNNDSRYAVLEIKEAVCMLPQYRDTMLSVHVYEAVLENGIKGIDEFMEWWKKNYGK
jgi:hypothetical protein